MPTMICPRPLKSAKVYTTGAKPGGDHLVWRNVTMSSWEGGGEGSAEERQGVITGGRPLGMKVTVLVGGEGQVCPST